MKRAELTELQYIAAIENLESILKLGLLCNNQVAARKLAHRSVADPDIQARREKKVPGGLRLHDYVNLYVNARNKMMFKVVKTGDHKSLMVLAVSTDVLDIPNVVITDRNAAASDSYVRWSESPAGLAHIDRDYVFAQYWTHPDDPIEQFRHGSAMCAEVLVPKSVAPTYIVKIYVSCPSAHTKVSGLAKAAAIPVAIKASLFFQ